MNALARTRAFAQVATPFPFKLRVIDDRARPSDGRPLQQPRPSAEHFWLAKPATERTVAAAAAAAAAALVCALMRCFARESRAQ